MTTARDERPPGRIVTFYSYKGGTGRSMALANVGWILASNGYRVLAIDWDFEAPGLHRYFHPFLADPELTSSPGLIDFFVEFAAASRAPHDASSSGQPWYDAYSSLLRYAYSLEWDFPKDATTGKRGTLDFVPAGQQGPSYAVNVTSFDWRGFYEKLGGGLFLEAVKRELRKDYDFVLIDSRTGLSDTSGICTVQMPDEIVLCFTLNLQSIHGAAAVMDSAESQRRRSTGEPTLRIWPVPTRVELGEKDRLDRAFDLARHTFQRYLGHLSRVERSSYWGRVQVLYQPYFAYEEVLATFANRKGDAPLMLTSMETIASQIRRAPTELVQSEADRRRGLHMFEKASAAASTEPSIAREGAGRVYLSYTPETSQLADSIVRALESRGMSVWTDQRLLPGDDWQEVMATEIREADAFVVLLNGRESEIKLGEISLALSAGKRIVPVLTNSIVSVPDQLKRFIATRLDAHAESIDAVAVFAGQLEAALRRRPSDSSAGPVEPVDPDDPQKGQWGGRSHANGRELSAKVRPLSDDWFEVMLRVRSTTKAVPLMEPVQFHLHPTFPESRKFVHPESGVATLRLVAWGAFTVGASTDGGRTRLELDLSENTTFPKAFLER